MLPEPEIKEYEGFLASKITTPNQSGFAVDARHLNRKLFPFQRAIVRWALQCGRAAIFAAPGLGKTLMQLAWAEAVVRQRNTSVLVLTPLAVASQTVREATTHGIKAKVAQVANQGEVEQLLEGRNGIAVTNYQKLDKFDLKRFGGVVLDESSILKNYTGQTKQQLIQSFAGLEYKLCCTATPAPNDYVELGNHAEFLDIMPSPEMLSRWFINDQAQTGNYRLKHHAAEDFYCWIATWAASLNLPSDLGFSDAGYALPDLKIVDEVVSVDIATGAEAGNLFRSGSLNATSIHKELRFTAPERAKRVAEIVAKEPAESWLIWCNSDYEQAELVARIPGAVSVHGGLSESAKVKCLDSFSTGKSKILISKPSICGYGMNWQHCSRIAFIGLSYSFEQFFQALRRCWRFGQSRPVNCHIVLAETEGNVLRVVREKQAEHEKMICELSRFSTVRAKTKEDRLQLSNQSIGTLTESKEWQLYNGDCVAEVRKIPDRSIHFTIFSPPFSNLYIYTDSVRDMGNCANHEEFFRHFGYLVPELLRVTIPGRLCAVHCKDLPLYRGRDGACGLYDFPGDLIQAFRRGGWTFHSRVTIWKCPVVERERTDNNGLLHKTLCRDSSQVRQGMADFLLVFRRNPLEDNLSDIPVARPNGLTEWPGEPGLDPRVTDWHPSPYARKPKAATDDSIKLWQRLADPVWYHIDQMETLNEDLGRTDRDERHICPLQLGVVKSAVELWTLPGERVLSPFAGIGSEGYQSLLMGRRFTGIELKESYFEVAKANLEMAVRKRASDSRSLFASLESN